MLHADNPAIRALLLHGNFGLEKESMRVTGDGFLAQTPDPFSGHEHIVRDFSEAQVEINTGIQPTPAAVVAELDEYNGIIQRTLRDQPKREYLWPSSNPPCLRCEEDVPIAQFGGALAQKTAYREHLAEHYGRYKMTFSGIHFNYSFADDLLRADFELSDFDDFDAYKSQLYLDLAERAEAYGYILTAVTAASPVMDMSYVETESMGQDLFMGFATVRCSELGYWNSFAPQFDYSSVPAYADGIQAYVDSDMIRQPSELYFPVRLKPPGENTLDGLRQKGVSHIELRMFDLNPLVKEGIDERDVLFAQLLLVWFACTDKAHMTSTDQVRAVHNLKAAARCNLDRVNIVLPGGKHDTVANASLRMIGLMEDFYSDFGDDVKGCLAFQRSKFEHPETRYSWRLRHGIKDTYAKDMLALAKARQAEY